MKTIANIWWKFLAVAYDYGMGDNLTQDEINELAAISENRTFRTLIKRHDVLQAKKYGTKEFKGLSYYQVMRPTIVLMATHLEKQAAACRNLRVSAIIAGYVRTILDKMEYNINFYQWRFVNLIKAFPNMSDAALAKYCIVNKISMQDKLEHDCDVNYLIKIFQETRRCMNLTHVPATAPITQHESIYAARWLEIYERQK